MLTLKIIVLINTTLKVMKVWGYSRSSDMFHWIIFEWLNLVFMREGGGTSIWNCILTFHSTNYTKISVICRRTQLVLGLSAWLIPPPKIFYSKIMRHKSVLYDKIIRCKRLPAIMLCIMTSADTSRASQLVICSNEKFSNWNSKTIALYCDEEER